VSSSEMSSLLVPFCSSGFLDPLPACTEEDRATPTAQGYQRHLAMCANNVEYCKDRPNHSLLVRVPLPARLWVVA